MAGDDITHVLINTFDQLNDNINEADVFPGNDVQWTLI